MTDLPDSSPDPIPDPDISWRRFVPLLLVIGSGLTLVGFIVGIADTRLPARTNPPVRRDLQVDAAAPARSYRELFAKPLSPNAEWRSALNKLKFDRPDLFAPVVRTVALNQAAIADRARTRAYEGAPPVIPHPVEQQAAASCLACHGTGMKVGERIAVKISHAHFTSCTQCHVEAHGSPPVADEPAAANGFVGLERSGPGVRAFFGSPPTIPHTTWLREDCRSCHGVIARPGLRTTHPWLANCLQCHAPSAELDRVPFRVAEAGAMFVAPPEK